MGPLVLFWRICVQCPASMYTNHCSMVQKSLADWQLLANKERLIWEIKISLFLLYYLNVWACFQDMVCISLCQKSWTIFSFMCALRVCSFSEPSIRRAWICAFILKTLVLIHVLSILICLFWVILLMSVVHLHLNMISVSKFRTNWLLIYWL